ncbi:subtilisin-like protease SBT4.11 [Bidens hawaiensis]|uniref:subtilisin-like protease SBT4.11 n=1 Tax=Bidens hawaiensis TaxID=980011 RepID=UPI00404AEF55
MEMLRIFLTICLFISSVSSRDQERKVYIVYMGSLPKGEYSPTLHHMEIIKQVVHPSFSDRALIRSYKRSINGFAAHLSEQEKEKLTRVDGIVSIFPNQKLHLQTTNSWNFMGLPRGVDRHVAMESDTIIGVIDGGIWPESESFNDKGYAPIPAKWKGACDGVIDFVCNRKIIGARTFTFVSWDLSARDTSGHGTHCASVIYGNEVAGANYYGFAKGIARGVPLARIAAYKVCTSECNGVDIMSAFDHAIDNGVDIISISLGFQNSVELTQDPIAIGAFHVMERAILIVNAAGNDGPSLYSINSYAPWVLTVGASDTNRRFVDKLLLGTGEVLVGHAINPFPSSDEPLPLIYGKGGTSNCSITEAR